MKATAAVLRSHGAPLTIEEIELDDPGVGEVLVRMISVGICRTDVEASHNWQLPAVLGHEGAGVVEAVGPGVTAVAPGDRVILSFRSCRSCPQCAHGEPGYCRTFEPLNFSGLRPDGSTTARDADGVSLHTNFVGQSSFASHTVVDVSAVVPVGPDVDLSVLGAIGCGVQTGAGTVLNELRSRPGDAVVVFGAGTVGLAAIMAAKLAGCGPIAAVDVSDDRRALALELGATVAIDARSPSLLDELGAAAPHGFDAAIDTTGIGEVVTRALTVLNRRGTCAVIGKGAEDEITVDWLTLLNGRTLTGIIGGSSLPQVFVPQLVDFHRRGLFPVDRLVTTFPFSDIADAFAAMERGEVIKPILLF